MQNKKQFKKWMIMTFLCATLFSFSIIAILLLSIPNTILNVALASSYIIIAFFAILILGYTAKWYDIPKLFFKNPIAGVDILDIKEVDLPIKTAVQVKQHWTYDQHNFMTL